MTVSNMDKFSGKDKQNPTEQLKKINYKKTSLSERREIVEDILSTGYYEDYFDNNFKVGINSTDLLSDHDSASRELERMANYLLNSDEIKEDKKETEYKFYTNEQDFQTAIRREAKIDSMGAGNDSENIIHFLKRENRNYKKSKTQVINKKDLMRNDELGELLRDYQNFLDYVTETLKSGGKKGVSRYLLTKASGAVSQDMIMCKDIMLGVFGYKTNATESTVIDWDQVDYTNAEHIKALLYFDSNYKGNEDLKYIVIDFNEILNSLELNELQREIIGLLRRDKNITDISKILGVTRKTVYHNINVICNKIIESQNN